MIAAEPVAHIRLDGNGVAWIDGTKVKVVEVVLEHLTNGSSAEEIHFQHPHLSLAQIHSALAYYFDHRSELTAEIERRNREVETLKTEAQDQPARKKKASRAPAQTVSVGLYLDVHVRRAVTMGLRLRHADVVAAQQDGAERFEDNKLLDRALELGRTDIGADELNILSPMLGIALVATNELLLQLTGEPGHPFVWQQSATVSGGWLSFLTNAAGSVYWSVPEILTVTDSMPVPASFFRAQMPQ